MLLKIGKWQLSRKKEDQLTMGVSSLLPNGKHYLQLDYDDIFSLQGLKQELKRLIRKFKLGDLEIYESSYTHYIVFGFYETLTYKDYIWICYNSNCDPKFKRWRMCRQDGVLRILPKEGSNPKPKPIYITTIKGNKKSLPQANNKIRNMIDKVLK